MDMPEKPLEFLSRAGKSVGFKNGRVLKVSITHAQLLLPLMLEIATPHPSSCPIQKTYSHTIPCQFGTLRAYTSKHNRKTADLRIRV
jgi:hypothetical protein